MTEAINQPEGKDPLQETKDLTAQWVKYFNGIVIRGLSRCAVFSTF